MQGSVSWSPDSLDFRIIGEMIVYPSYWNVRKSYKDIAKKIGVDQETIRLRLRRMRQQGYLLGWRLIPNPLLIGRGSFTLLMEFDDQTANKNARNRLQHTAGVVIMIEFYERHLSVNLFHNYSEEELAKEAQSIAFSCKGKLLTFWQRGSPGVTRKLTKLDWEIIEGLMGNPERKLSDLADRLGVSTRTVKRKVNDLMQSHSLFLLPVVDLKKIKGVPCQLLVEADPSKKNALDRLIIGKFAPIMNFRDTGSRTHSLYGIACNNVAEAEESRKWIQNQPGVQTVWMNIVGQLTHVYDWIESRVSLMVSRSNA
ncbi:MAG TPA: winged helix-turn-helix transcriptional regulator [Candidatus Acidoferrum sp.]|nr:winged helix-turn-helix transcriptional regulator [Candidatus Acidoferrum sp.]